ncbi:MAG: hypothetical protein KDK27_06395, partial [Leptospiraceae bacterium]|nr:hypothetical protein [Leptospiraceae bacterium]
MKSLPELIQNFPDRTILVVGDFMLDEYVYGSVDRISQEAPVPVVLEQRIAHVPGGAGNVVRNLRALGARVLLAGVIGSDEAGRDLIDSFEKSGHERSDIGLFSLAGRPTTRKTRIIAARQQVCRLDREDRSPLPMDLKNRITDFITRRAGEVDAIIIS